MGMALSHQENKQSPSTLSKPSLSINIKQAITMEQAASHHVCKL
jgi:hypothetical protein